MQATWTGKWRVALLPALTLNLLAGCGIDADNTPGPDTGVAEWPAQAFKQALAPRDFSFPEDHGPHPGFRDEWWYVTGNLWDEDRNRYGFQLTLFRRALQPGQDTAVSDTGFSDTSMSMPNPTAPDGSTGAVPAQGQSYMGHFAITDVGGGRFFHSERFGRPLAGIAGSGHSPPRAWLDDWRLEWRQDHWSMSARHAQWALDLRLEPAFAPILQGDAGYSRKNAEPGNASFYYSQPRLRATGTLERPVTEDCATHSIDRSDAPTADRSTLSSKRDSNPSGRCPHHRLAVNGLAWLDREWGSSQLAPEQQGWDWFALQLDDGRALMIYQLRDAEGRADPYSAGSLISADGQKQPLEQRDFSLQSLHHWTSPDGARIPIRWRLRLPAYGIDWQVSAVDPAQYLEGVFSYWEGAVDVSAGRDAVGVGYLEMTGYRGD